jgi:hypothetical protein
MSASRSSTGRPCRRRRSPRRTYWNGLWSWYEREGFGHVAAYLAQLELSGFDLKAPPPQAPALWVIVDANRAPEHAELADVVDDLGRPDTVTISRIATAADVGICAACCSACWRASKGPRPLFICQRASAANCRALASVTPDARDPSPISRRRPPERYRKILLRSGGPDRQVEPVAVRMPTGCGESLDGPRRERLESRRPAMMLSAKLSYPNICPNKCLGSWRIIANDCGPSKG